MKSWKNHARRVSEILDPSREDLMTIEESDVEEPDSNVDDTHVI